jgi:hypothetical protein
MERERRDEKVLHSLFDSAFLSTSEWRNLAGGVVLSYMGRKFVVGRANRLRRFAESSVMART